MSQPEYPYGWPAAYASADVPPPPPVSPLRNVISGPLTPPVYAHTSRSKRKGLIPPRLPTLPSHKPDDSGKPGSESESNDHAKRKARKKNKKTALSSTRISDRDLISRFPHAGTRREDGKIVHSSTFTRSSEMKDNGVQHKQEWDFKMQGESGNNAGKYEWCEAAESSRKG